MNDSKVGARGSAGNVTIVTTGLVITSPPVFCTCGCTSPTRIDATPETFGSAALVARTWKMPLAAGATTTDTGPLVIHTVAAAVAVDRALDVAVTWYFPVVVPATAQLVAFAPDGVSVSPAGDDDHAIDPAIDDVAVRGEAGAPIC